MPISKTARAALRALSYPASLEVDKTYRVERAIQHIRTPLAPLYHLWDRKIERDGREIRVRLYQPPKGRSDQLLLFFHGGGWVVESVDTYNRVCRNMAKRTGCQVASVEYGLAPESPFPEGLEDCYAAARAVYRHPEELGVHARSIILIGDSAGGNLAAAVSLLARDRGEFQVERQILIYPATYHDHSPASPFPSVRENGTEFLLTSQRVEDFIDLYCGGDPEKRRSPYLAPLLSGDLTRQPRTLVITAEYDPLRDEGEAYAAALAKAGAEVEAHRMPNALHGYFSLPLRFAQVRQTYAWINEFLKRGDLQCQTNGETGVR